MILLYELGPGEYNTADWDQFGDGWDWIKATHGVEQADEERWTAKGINSGQPLANKLYPNERLMNLGNADWVNYHWQELYSDWWGGAKGDDHSGADGIFADVFAFGVTYAVNFSYMDTYPDYWTELDRLANVPFAAMQERVS